MNIFFRLRPVANTFAFIMGAVMYFGKHGEGAPFAISILLSTCWLVVFAVRFIVLQIRTRLFAPCKKWRTTSRLVTRISGAS